MAVSAAGSDSARTDLEDRILDSGTAAGQSSGNVIMLMLYYSLGTTLERTWGAFRYNVYIFSGILFTVLGAFVLYILYGSGADFLGGYFSTYYINLSIFLAFAASYPDMELLLYFILPIKIKWMGLVYGVYILYQLATGNPASRIVIISSLLNFVVFFLSSRNLKPYTPKEQVRKAKFRQQTRPHMTYAMVQNTVVLSVGEQS